MNKEQLTEILQSTLLYFEGQSEQELNTWMNPSNVKVGIKMCSFLQEKVK